ncbi:MAG: hypothetical protein EGR08_01775 [Prevotella sp.]|nr:hypothetical protein [Prevotella sp.]
MTAKVLIFLYLRIIILLNKRKRVARRSHMALLMAAIRLFKKQPLSISRSSHKAFQKATKKRKRTRRR